MPAPGIGGITGALRSLSSSDADEYPTATWKVTIVSIQNLGEAEYRVGDLSEQVAHGLSQAVADAGARNALCGGVAYNPFQVCIRPHIVPDSDLGFPGTRRDSASLVPLSQAGARSAKLGKVAIELQVGDVKKRTKSVQCDGEAEVQVDEAILVPAATSDPMTIRVFRVGHVQSDALIGEHTNFRDDTLQGSDTMELELPLSRADKGQGSIRLSIQALDDAFVPVATSPRRRTRDRLSRVVRRAKKVRNKIMDKYFSNQASGVLSQSLIEDGHDDDFEDPLGMLTVTIEKVTGLEAKAQKPYFKLNFEGKEEKANKFKSRHARELIYTFPVAHLHEDLRIYCYDELSAFNRHHPVGRVLLPLTTLLSTFGLCPSLSAIKSSLHSASIFEQRFVCRFMPVTEAGDGHAIPGFCDIFRPGSMPGSDVFGQVVLHLSLSIGPPALSPLHCYIDSFTQGVREAKELNEQKQDGSPGADNEEVPDLISVLRNVDVNQTVRNLNRLQALAQTWRYQHGFIRWIREEPWRGRFAAFVWLCMCIGGIFPPPLYACPVWIWLGFVLNGLLAARYREQAWEEHSAYVVFNEEKENPTLRQRIDVFKRGVHEIERHSHTFVSFLERVSNLFNFADVPASLLWCTGSGAAALAASILCYVIAQVDPDGYWTWGVAGAIIIYGLSKQPARPMKRVQTSGSLQGRSPNPLKPLADLLRPLAMFNAAMACVPDMGQLAHRYIVTRVQCVSSRIPGVLRISILSAQGLRAADWATASSDPFCTCQIFGKPESLFKTGIIYRTLEPVWRHEQNLSYHIGDDLLFQVWDYDVGKSPDFLGRAVLKYEEFASETFDGELQLLDATGSDQSTTPSIRIIVAVGTPADVGI